MGTMAGWYPHPDDPTKELRFDGTEWGESRVLRFERNKPVLTEAAGWYPHPDDDDTQVEFDGAGWTGSRVLHLENGETVAATDGKSPVAQITAAPPENPTWVMTRRLLSFGPLVAIAAVGIIAILTTNGR
ncbi:hypothetical protein [Plantibacter sp. YIM 135249]|uniref:hypothetical protein n=1 Tax=Plantibacter sp. YIM 135249 TaxID=3423918 RepID=UPI003D352D7B